MGNTVHVSVTGVSFASPVHIADDLTVTIDLGVGMTDVNGAVTGVDGAENVVVTLYYLAEGAGFPVGGVDTLAALTADADLELGSVTFAGPLQAGAASDSVTIAEAAILTAVGASNDAAGRVYAVVSSFDLVDAVNDVADVTPAADITFDALEVQSADLQVSIALAEAGSIAVGEDVRVDYTMTNAGDVDADDAVVTFYWEDANGDNDVVVGSATGDVNAGATRSGHIAIDYDTLLAEVGDHASEGRIYAVIDAADAVEEILNEGNNTAAAVALTFDNPNSLADLTVYDLSISDSALDFGEDLSLRLKFGNDDDTGYADATGVVLKVFDDTDTLIHTEAVGDLELGSFDYNYTFDVDFGALRAADAQSIYVTIEGAEDDLSAANDTTASVAITVDTTENLPELDITAQEINGGDHADIAVGTDILWTYAVTNSGDLAAYDVVTTFYVADDAAGLNEVAIGTDKNYTLSIGETDDNEKIYLDYEDIKQYSGKFFYARVDATDDVDESDDTAADNQSTPTQLTFAPEVADLKVNAFTTKGYDAVDGITIDYEDDKVTLKLKIENEGTADFAGASTSYYFSTNDTLELDGAGAPDGTDTLIGTDVHGLLSAGEVDGYEPFTLTWADLQAYAGQTVYVIGMANAALGGGETDMSDNLTDALELHIEDAPTPADVSIVWSFAGGDNSVAFGERADVEATLSNSGETDAKSVITTYYYNADGVAGVDAAADATNTVVAVDHNGWLSAGEVDDNEGAKIKFNAFGLDEDDADGVIYAVVQSEGVEVARSAGQIVDVDAPEAADLGYTAVTIEGGNTLAVGEKIQVNMTVANAGELKGQSKTDLYWSANGTFEDADDVFLDREFHGSIEGGASKSESERFTFDTLAQNGDGQLLAVLSEKVNGVWVQRDVSAIDYDFAGGTSEYVADLQYADITTNLVGGTLAENQTLDIDLEVTNTGLQGARGITTFYWSQDGTLDVGEFVELGTDDHFNVKAGELDANEGKTFTYETILEKIEDAGLDAGAAGGTLIAVLDADDLVDEGAGGEANNTTSVAMAIDELEGADLIISTGEVSRTTVADGQRVSVTYTVENVGDEEVISRTKFYWSDDDTFDIGDTLLGIDSNGTMRVGQDKGQSDKFGYSELSSLAGSQGFIIGVVEVKTGNPEADDTNNIWVSDAITVEKDGNAPVVFDGGISDTEGTVTEDGGLVVGGALVATDADAFDVITWSGGSTSDYGTMTIDAGGNWSYTLDNDADALNLLDTGAEVADVFIFEATDGDGSTIQATVGIIVHGADEAVLDFTGAAGASFGGYDWVNHTFANDAVEGQFTVSDAAAFDFVSFTVDTSDDVTLTVTGGTGIGAQSVSVDLVGALVDEAVTIDLNGFTEYEVTAVGAGAGDFVIDDLILV